MTEDSVVSQAVDVIRRQWWIVLLVVAAALSVAAVLSSGAPDTFTATAAVVIDTTPSSRYRGMPLPDDLVRHVSDADLREAVAEAAGLSKDEVAGALRGSAAGNPLTRITITFSGDSEEVAARAAGAAAEELVAWVNESAGPETEYRESQIEATRAALESLSDDPGAAPAQIEETAYKRWQLQTRLLDYEAALRSIEDVYSFDGDVDTSVRTGVTVLRRDLVGAGIAGLVLGLLVAAAREALSRRQSAA